jgi:hypothetical protein
MNDALSPGADLAKVYGESTRCPACGAFAKTLPDQDYRWVCAVCGAPRVVMPDAGPLPEEAAVALREASSAQRTAALQRVLSFVMGIPAGFALIMAVMLAPASFIAAGIIIASGIGLALLALRASRRASTERKRLRGAVERAYEAAIGELAGQDKSMKEIATGLRIAEADVEAALALSGRVRVEVPKRIAASDAESAEEAEAAQAEAEAEKKR